MKKAFPMFIKKACNYKYTFTTSLPRLLQFP